MVRKLSSLSLVEAAQQLWNQLFYSQPQPALYEQILLFGDSITEFAERQELGFAFAAALRADYMRKLEVVNRGLRHVCKLGYNTELALKVIKFIIPPPTVAKVRLLTIFFGANDCCFEVTEPGQNQCVPLPQFRENMMKIVRDPHVVAQNPRIVIFTPPPIDERQQWAIDMAKGFTSPRRSAENTRKYAEMVRSVAEKELNVPIVDLWQNFMKHCGWNDGEPLPGSQETPEDPRFLELFTDGLHLSPTGYELMYKEFKAVIQNNWPEMIPEKLDFVLPVWNLFPIGWTEPLHQQ